jgi:hypothetical protein
LFVKSFADANANVLCIVWPETPVLARFQVATGGGVRRIASHRDADLAKHKGVCKMIDTEVFSSEGKKIEAASLANETPVLNFCHVCFAGCDMLGGACRASGRRRIWDRRLLRWLVGP